jgi:DNA-binding response OmpR family regulator
LIIEREVMTALGVEQYLARLGFGTFEYADTIEAGLAEARNRHPDAIAIASRIVQGSGIRALERFCSERNICLVSVPSSLGLSEPWRRRIDAGLSR